MPCNLTICLIKIEKERHKSFEIFMVELQLRLHVDRKNCLCIYFHALSTQHQNFGVKKDSSSLSIIYYSTRGGGLQFLS